MNLFRIFSDFRLFGREYIRSGSGVALALILPVLLILLFGALFSGSSGSPITVYVQNNDSGTLGVQFVSALNQTGLVKAVAVSPSIDLRQFLLDNSHPIGIYIPENFSSFFESGVRQNVTVYANPADASSTLVVQAASAVLNQFNLHAAGANLLLGLSERTVNSQTPRYIDFLIPTLIGFSILTTPMYSLVEISAEYKRSKLFKELSLTPLSKSEWLISKFLWYAIMSIASFVLLVLTGTFVFQAKVVLTLWILPFLVAGPLFFVALGMLVSTLSKSPESAGLIANVLTIPMMFLSGAIFPIGSLPSGLATISQLFPLYYVTSGLNDVMIYRNYAQASIYLLVVLMSATITFLLAVRLFKWRED